MVLFSLLVAPRDFLFPRDSFSSFVLSDVLFVDISHKTLKTERHCGYWHPLGLKEGDVTHRLDKKLDLIAQGDRP